VLAQARSSIALLELSLSPTPGPLAPLSPPVSVIHAASHSASASRQANGTDAVGREEGRIGCVPT
jgi:hypothetical protein